jgi:hypothetical protein
VLQDEPDLVRFSKKMLLVWDGNHCIEAWMPYFNKLHSDEPSWHINADLILLNTFHVLVELLTSMIDLNK